MRYQDAFDIARKTAQIGSASPATDYAHGAVILDRRGRIIAAGRNHFAGKQIETGEGIINRTVHAEIHALSKVNIRRLDGATIIVYGRTNVAAILSRPCSNCWTVLEKLGFSKVFYTVRSNLNKPLWREENF